MRLWWRPWNEAVMEAWEWGCDGGLGMRLQWGCNEAVMEAWEWGSNGVVMEVWCRSGNEAPMGLWWRYDVGLGMRLQWGCDGGMMEAWEQGSEGLEWGYGLTWPFSHEAENDSDLDSKFLLSPFQSIKDSLYVFIRIQVSNFSSDWVESALTIDNIVCCTVFTELVCNSLYGLLSAVMRQQAAVTTFSVLSLIQVTILTDYCNESNYSNHQTPPPFPRKIINYCIPSIRRTTYSNIWTPTPCGGRTWVAKRLLAFDSLCGATARVIERLIAYCRCFLTSMGVAKTCTSLQQSLQSLNRGCKMCTSLRQSLQSLNGG